MKLWGLDNHPYLEKINEIIFLLLNSVKPSESDFFFFPYKVLYKVQLQQIGFKIVKQ